MRNLKCLRHSVVKVATDPPLTASTWDVATDTLLCAYGPTVKDPLIVLRRVWYDRSQASTTEAETGTHGTSNVQEVASWDAPPPSPDLPHDRILSLHYFADDQVVCLALAGGDIIFVREEPAAGQDKIEILGTVDAGITAARWSPDEEVLAITTKQDTLLLMTRDLENLAEIAMTDEDLKASTHVSVGWGKSETQFKGKRAKALRDPTMPEHVDEGRPSPHDDGRVTLSWRGDAAYLAISTLIPGRRRVIRVYAREGILDSVSEPVDGLEAALSWRPAGNLIAAIQRLADRVDVIFFERNGLRHGQFTLRLEQEDMTTWARGIDLDWNSYSTTLAAVFQDRAQLWTMGNYHYYLKQEIPFDQQGTDPPVMSTRWHPEKNVRLALTAATMLRVLQFEETTARGPVTPPNDLGSVAVIDGKMLKLTALRLANVPPPMAQYELPGRRPVVDVAFSPTGTRIATIDRDGLEIYTWDPRVKGMPEHQRKCWSNAIQIPEHPSLQLQQVCFGGEGDVVVLASEGTSSVIIAFSIGAEDGGFSFKSFCPEPRAVQRLFSSREGGVCALRADNVIMRVECHGDMVHLTEVIALSTRMPAVEAIHFEEEVSPHTSIIPTDEKKARHAIFFALGTNGLLFANERLLARNCTSILVTSTHLIYTTTQHLLKFVHMAAVDDLDVPLDNPEEDERCRSIERGAKLVTVMPTSFSLTLQMPRGNLETIYPRALVVAGIRQSIMAKDYRTAFLACRSHRVDMNILHDHAPAQFLQSVGLFVDQVKKIEHLDLFLSALKEEDVSRTMYRETTVHESKEINGEPEATSDAGHPSMTATRKTSKINLICDAFLSVLIPRISTNLQNIITAHVCKSPPDVEAGLTLVGKLRKDSEELAEKAIEHMCFLVDVNKLYDNALGLYDLELTLLVAQQSQKDPRDYLPFLQKLQSTPELRKRFTIDDGLGRHAKALNHLYELDVFDELKAYTIQHQLYHQALTLFRYRSEQLNEIMRLYADHLSRSSQFREAAIAYEFTGSYPLALDAYRAAGCWREALSCASHLGLDSSQLSALATSLAEALYESKSYEQAATIYLDHLQDIEAAAGTLCKGYLFPDAMRILGLHSRNDLLPSIIDQGLSDGLSTSTELLADCKDQLHAQVPRLRLLRWKKEEDPLAFYDGPSTDAAIPDNVSLAGTTASTTGGESLFTRYTGKTGTLNTQTSRRTSKNRRKEERKRARGKKGSVYEEEYLVQSIARLMERVEAVREEVQRLVEGCMRRGMRERAMALQKQMGEVVGLCGDYVVEVFTDNSAHDEGFPTIGDHSGDAQGEHRPGADGVVQESLESRNRKQAIPIGREFKKLTLLGG